MNLTPGPHGGDANRLAKLLGCSVSDILDLSASLNPVAPDPKPVVHRHLDAIDRYPDDSVATKVLSEALGADPERVLLTNGGAEAIALVALLHPIGDCSPLDFSLYKRHLTSVEPGAPRWMSDPNNPTGLLAKAEDTAFVRDEAFYSLATGQWTRGDADSIVVGSLTKVFACPGLRLGYVIARTPDEANRLRQLRPQWSINGLAAQALPELVGSADLAGWVKGISELRDQLCDVLADYDLQTSPGLANYVWIESAPGLRDVLLPHGVLVRSGASFGFPDAVRIAVPGSDGLTRLQISLAAAL